jgi:predicted AAA+ superfamily ATPase
LESNEKYYFEDLGIRNALVHSTDTNDIEKRIENAVFLHLLRCGYTVYIGQLRSKEIDFVAHKGDKTLYVQVAYLITGEETEKREFGNLLAIPDNHPKIVISLNPMNIDSNYNGIRHLHLREFLKIENI